jgi:hypothetical protein
MKKKTQTMSVVTMIKEKTGKTPSIGRKDTFQLLCRASSEDGNWVKTTRAMEIQGTGCIVQVTTQQGNNIAEAVCFVPGVTIVPDINKGQKLVYHGGNNA